MDNKYRNIGHILDRTSEECAEVIQIICKIRRFGKDSYHPHDEKKTTNIQLLLNEINDCKARLDELEDAIINNTL